MIHVLVISYMVHIGEQLSLGRVITVVICFCLFLIWSHVWGFIPHFSVTVESS